MATHSERVSHSVVSNSLQPHRLQPTRLSVHGIFQTRTLKLVANSCQPRNRTQVCVVGRFFIMWGTRETQPTLVFLIYLHFYMWMYFSGELKKFTLASSLLPQGQKRGNLPFHVFRPHCAACRILVSWPGVQLLPQALGVQHLNHWTTMEVSLTFLFKEMSPTAF